MRILFVITILLFFTPIKAGAQMEAKHILILHSYHRELGWTDNISQGIDKKLKNSRYPIETFTEYMDTKRIFDDRYLENLAALLTYKYQNRKFDVVISSDDHAFQFLRHHNRIFNHTPVVFCGVNYFKDEFIANAPNFTGLVESFGIKETIEAALTIHPDLGKIYSVVDGTVTGKANLNLLNAVIPGFKDRLEFITITDMDMTEVVDTVRQLPPESIVLLLAFTSDRSGNTYSLEQSADLITAASNRPVYSFWDFHLNHGILGGMLTTGQSQGIAAAELALRILDGESPANIPVIKASPNHYIFDFNTLKKFGLSTSNLPPGSNIINQPLSFYEQYRWMVWQVLFVFILLVVFLIILSINLVKKRRAESCLKKSEQRLFLHLQNTPVGVVSWDLELKAIEWNPAAESIFGYTREEAMGKHMAELILPKNLKESVDGVFQDLLMGRGGERSVRENITKTGRHILCDWFNTVLKDSNGQIIGVASLVNDITERKRSEDINKLLFAVSNAVNITLNLDDLYRQVHFLLGQTMDATNFFIAIVSGKKQTLYFPYFVDSVDQDFSFCTDFNPKASLADLVVLRQTPLLLTTKEIKRLSEKNGGGPVPMIWMGAPIMIKNEVIGVIAVQSYTDANLYTERDLNLLSSISDQIAISIDRKRVEDELRESEKRYRHLFNNAPAGMYEINFIKARLVEVNDILCKYTGYSETQLLSINPLDLFTRKSKKQFLKRYEMLVGGAKLSSDVEYEIITKEGQKIFVVLNSDYIYENEKLIGARVVVHDVTERKKIENMIIQSEKMMSLGGLAAGMAHEINNPLAGMIQNAQVIHNRLTKEMPANQNIAQKLGISMTVIKEYMEKRGILGQLESINIAGRRAAKIIENMLSFSKNSTSIKNHTKMDDLIDKTIDLAENDYDLKKKYDFRNIEILRDYSPVVPQVLCEASKIQQVLFNILKNASQALSQGRGQDGPKITIRLRGQRNTAIIEIEDNGPGIDPETRKHIFEPFFTTKRIGEGTGLGLFVSYFIIVEDHKGKLEVKSTRNYGTKFIITLPLEK